MKSAVELKWLLLKFVLSMSGGYSGKFSQRQYRIQLPKDNLGEQKFLESPVFRFSENLKSKILTTMVPPPEYTLTPNLPFRATRRLKCMSSDRKVSVNSDRSALFKSLFNNSLCNSLWNTW